MGKGNPKGKGKKRQKKKKKSWLAWNEQSGVPIDEVAWRPCPVRARSISCCWLWPVLPS